MDHIFDIDPKKKCDVMKLKRITVRIHPLLWNKLEKLLSTSIDARGFQHCSTNYWINIAIKEKIENDKKI